MSTSIPFHRSLSGRMLIFGVFPTAIILLGIIVWLAVAMVSELRIENEHDMQILADRVAAEIERGNTRAVLVAQVMAQAQENGLFGNRPASVAYARDILASYPELTGAYFGYEPDADSQDRGAPERTPEIAEALDPSGRFIPYWFRDHQNNELLRLEPLVDMETSLYYQGCKDLYLAEGRPLPMVTEPYVYEGKMIVEQTFPIVIDGEFAGIAGVDRALSDIEVFLQDIRRRDEVDVFLISRSGKFVAATNEMRAEGGTPTVPDGEPLLRTRKIANSPYAGVFGPFFEQQHEQGFQLATDPLSGRRHYFASAPIPTGRWMVVISRTESAVTAPIRERMVPIVILILIGLLVVVGISLWVTRTTSRRIRRAVHVADRLALGDVDVVTTVEKGVQDETGQLAESFDHLVESYREITHMCCAIARGDFSQNFEKRSETDELADALNEMSVRRQQAEQAVLRARDAAEQANHAKSEFLAKMSHELRTPMNAIIGYSEMLEEEAEDLEQSDFIPDLQKIQAAGKHLLALINDILDLSKIEAGKMELHLERFGVAQMIEEVSATVHPLAAKNSNALVVECGDDVGEMQADLVKVRQGLFNLLSNACKFTRNGRVTLSARRVPGQAGDRIVFDVSDSGIGMTEEELGRIFEAFGQADSSTTRQFGGTGLGLTITRRFSELMGGSVSVKSEKGVGSTFTIELPAECQKTEKPESAAASQADPQTDTECADAGGAAIVGPETGALVLVIDDEADARDLLTRMLSKEGFRVVSAASGDEGLQLAHTLQPAAITLDVMMPGLDGWAVLKRLKAVPETASIPVLICTILRDEAMAYTLGAAEFITKPVDRERLVDLLGQCGTENGRSALVIEDDPDSRDVMTRLLEREGWHVRSAENGQEGLDRVADEIPAIILLDIMMPVMDGFEFLQELRRRPEWQQLPVVVVTAKELTTEERLILENSAQRVVAKEADGGQTLLGALENVLSGRPDEG